METGIWSYGLFCQGDIPVFTAGYFCEAVQTKVGRTAELNLRLYTLFLLNYQQQSLRRPIQLLVWLVSIVGLKILTVN